MKPKFVVTHGNRRWSRPTLADAVGHAKYIARGLIMEVAVVSVWDAERRVTAAVVTDDANGLKVHKLAWPAGEPDPE